MGGFAGKAKCTSHSPAERWVLDTQGWGDASLGWLLQELDAPVGPLQGPAASGSQLAVSDHCCLGASEPPAPGAGTVGGCRLTQCKRKPRSSMPGIHLPGVSLDSPVFSG